MKRFYAIIVATVFMSGSLFAQDSNLKLNVTRFNPETEKNSQTVQQNDNFKLFPFESMVNPLDNTKPLNLRYNLPSKKPFSLTPEQEAKLPANFREKSNELFKHNKNVEKKSPTFQNEMTQLPQNIRYIGEFEESQAVLVSVPSQPAFLVGGTYYPVLTTNFARVMRNVLQQLGLLDVWTDDEIFEALHLYYLNCKPGEALFWPALYMQGYETFDIRIIPRQNVFWISSFNSMMNSSANSITERYIWSNLINAIQDADAQVWIRMTAIQDTTALKNYMTQHSMPLTNYKFFRDDAGEDAFWVRDWGPHGFYYEENGTQKLGFHDAVYYTGLWGGRPIDDVFPRKLLDGLGYDWYDLQIQMEGGNIMTDGWGNASWGDRIYGLNDTIVYVGWGGQTYKGNPQGQFTYNYETENWYIPNFKLLNRTELDAKKKVAFNLDNPNVFQSLRFDGGTGHIDLWIKQFDEESMLITQMEDKYSVLTDYQLIQQNRTYLNNKTTFFGTKYRYLNVPLPKRFDSPSDCQDTPNGDMPTNNLQFDCDPRGYLNGLVVNKSYIYPSFSRTPADPSWQSDSIAKEILQKLLPGYKLVPIDSRSLTPGGGAIHCITMQIPQDPSKVITLRHKPIRGNRDGMSVFSLSTELISNTDANKLVAYWRKVNETEWQTVELTPSADLKLWDGNIEGNFQIGDTVRYFIAAQRDNDIRKAAPITGGKNIASDGYYEFYIETVSIDELYGFEPKASIIASIYPNPATDYLNVIFENITDGNVTIEIVNSLGQTLSTPVNKHFNKGVFIFDVPNLNDLNSGVYFLKMTTVNGVSTVNFVIK